MNPSRSKDGWLTGVQYYITRPQGRNQWVRQAIGKVMCDVTYHTVALVDVQVHLYSIPTPAAAMADPAAAASNTPIFPGDEW